MSQLEGGRRRPAPVAGTLDIAPPRVIPRPQEPRFHRSDANNAAADYRLASRCVAGDVAAWEELYAQCHDPLCASVRVLLGRRGGDPDLVDEIAARVWYRLVDKDGELLSRYAPDRGARLTTYLRALAKDEMCRHFRAASRRRQREAIAVQARPKWEESGIELLSHDVTSFLATLTPQEHAFCREVLLGDNDSSRGNARTKTSVWQLTHRVYQKFRRFFRL
ncbi:MAG: hypothetical protein ABFC96_10165 [Thermoguttaceae bacterium]